MNLVFLQCASNHHTLSRLHMIALICPSTDLINQRRLPRFWISKANRELSLSTDRSHAPSFIITIFFDPSQIVLETMGKQFISSGGDLVFGNTSHLETSSNATTCCGRRYQKHKNTPAWGSRYCATYEISTPRPDNLRAFDTVGRHLVTG